MARAKRHYIPGYVWHITHRCHKREFLLKFPRDRRRWIEWLYQAKKRYSGLSVLNYMVHITYPPTCIGQWRQECHPGFDKVGSWQNWSGIQCPQRQERGILAGSLSCNGSGEESLFKTVYHVYRYEYGSCRGGRASQTMGILWV